MLLGAGLASSQRTIGHSLDFTSSTIISGASGAYPYSFNQVLPQTPADSHSAGVCSRASGELSPAPAPLRALAAAGRMGVAVAPALGRSIETCT